MPPPNDGDRSVQNHQDAPSPRKRSDRSGRSWWPVINAVINLIRMIIDAPRGRFDEVKRIVKHFIDWL